MKKVKFVTIPKVKTPKQRKYLIAILATLLGIFITIAIRQNDEPGLLTSAREDELVLILDDLSKQKDLLEVELIKQKQTIDFLKNGSNDEAQAASQKRIDQLILLSGTAPVSGRGIQVLMTGDTYSINAFTILDTVQELRDAGAVAIEINGIRIINSTYFNDTVNGININLTGIRSPYKLLALGDPETMSTALKIPGGMSESISTTGGRVVITESSSIEVNSVASITTPQYAQEDK